jgi:hypothetical protein
VRTRRSNRTAGDPRLDTSGKPPEEIGDGYEAAVPQGPHVGRRVRHRTEPTQPLLDRMSTQPHDPWRTDEDLEDLDPSSARLMSKRRGFERALSAADDREAFAREDAEVVVAAGVRSELGRQSGERRGDSRSRSGTTFRCTQSPYSMKRSTGTGVPKLVWVSA